MSSFLWLSSYCPLQTICISKTVTKEWADEGMHWKYTLLSTCNRKTDYEFIISHGQRNKDFSLFLFRIFHEQSEQNQLSEFGKTYKWYLFKDKFGKKNI